jgi:homoserine kinase type II
MAVFTTVNPTELEVWLTQYSLGQMRALHDIASGIENSNFFLTTTQGEYVLTIFERLTSIQLPFYLELMRHLATHAIPVPTPVAQSAGALFGILHNKPAAIVTRLHGSIISKPQPQHCHAVGTMLAQMHRAGYDFPLHQPNLRSLPWWHSASQAIMPFLNATQRQLLRSELRYQSGFFASSDYLGMPAGPCHNDLFRDNVFFTEAGPEPGNAQHLPEISGIFDFYFAGWDKWLFDVAVCVNDWCIENDTGRLNAARARAFLHAYQSIRPFTKAEVQHWQNMLRAAALRFWISRLHDFYQPRDALVLKPHDPRHFERILRARLEPTTTEKCYAVNRS